MKSKKLKLGIIGGGPNSWIGHVHRISSRFDDKYEIVAGVFSRNSKQSTSFGKSIGVSEDRCYSNYLTMANKESLRKDKIDVVSIMTPPGSHQIIAEKFIDKNIHIISDKPFAADLKQAKSLFNKIKKNKKIKYALTHNYSAYPMVREAKVLIEKGKIGKVEDINFEYVQDWSEGKTINKKNSRKMFRWKLDKKIVGVSTVLNELGSHACHLAGYMSGLKTKKVFFCNRRITAGDNKNIKVIKVNGSGVNLDKIKPQPDQKTKYHFILASRLMKEKGVNEFLDAAKAIKIKS